MDKNIYKICKLNFLKKIFLSCTALHRLNLINYPLLTNYNYLINCDSLQKILSPNYDTNSPSYINIISFFPSINRNLPTLQIVQLNIFPKLIPSHPIPTKV